MVQVAVNTPLTECKQLHKRTPDHILRFYIDYYNKVNSEQTATTFLQIYESTDEINRGSNNDQHHETSKEIKFG